MKAQACEWCIVLHDLRSGDYWFYFFFSSRRRHTSSLRDWSSDVCSSDLPSRCEGLLLDREAPSHREGGGGRRGAAHPPRPRSEERRVGKECRSRGSGYVCIERSVA